MTHDRDYWRAASDKRLIEEARDSGHELCVALGERFEDAVSFHHGAWQDESSLRATIDCLRAELHLAERRIAELRGE